MSRRNLEAYLRSRRIAYINVRDAAQAVGGAKAFKAKPLTDERGRVVPGKTTDGLPIFDYVIYGEGVALLVLLKSHKAMRDEDSWGMAHWQKLFGAGFVAVCGEFKTHPDFYDLGGSRVCLDDVVRPHPESEPAALQPVSEITKIQSQLSLF